MKKIITCALASLLGLSVFAASYTNNTYQKLAKEYTLKAERALDAGKYELAEEYAVKAKENAQLSDEYIQHALVRESAQRNVTLAKNKLSYMEKNGGKESHPAEYESAANAIAKAEEALAQEDWEAASAYARQAIETVDELYGSGSLPKYYVVRSWQSARDCFWNISGRSYVYNNPYLWKKLYEANKNLLPEPNNPDLIEVGTRLEIPSASGESRDGVYSPDKTYDTYKKR